MIPTVPNYPAAVGLPRQIEPILIPWRPNTSTISYAGPSRPQIAERLPRARTAHTIALEDARFYRDDSCEHARALHRAQWARQQVAILLTCQRALDTVWFDRSWFYFDDPEYARRRAI